MNIIDYFPTEITKLILMNLECDEILDLKDIEEFEKFVKDNNIFEDRKNVGYPRDKCLCYHKYISDINGFYMTNRQLLNLMTDSNLVLIKGIRCKSFNMFKMGLL